MVLKVATSSAAVVVIIVIQKKRKQNADVSFSGVAEWYVKHASIRHRWIFVNNSKEQIVSLLPCLYEALLVPQLLLCYSLSRSFKLLEISFNFNIPHIAIENFQCFLIFLVHF